MLLYVINVISLPLQLSQAQQQKKTMFENVEYEWNLSDDNLTDVSDDDENFKVSS